MNRPLPPRRPEPPRSFTAIAIMLCLAVIFWLVVGLIITFLWPWG